MDDGTPSLEVGFAIDTGGSFDNLMQLQSVMDSTEAKIVKEAQNIERATSGMLNLAGATASVTAFATATDRATQQAARSLAQVERSGESMVRSLERQASTFGKTASEIRAMKAEAAAFAAEQQGLVDLAERIRAAEAAIYDQEFAAARKAAQAAENAAQEKVAAAAASTAAAEREAQAIREAALAYQMFEARARQGIKAMRDQQAAEDAATLAAQKLSAAGERLRAQIDPATAAQQRFDREMITARDLIGAGAISLDEYCAKLRLEQQILKNTVDGHNKLTTAFGNNAFAIKGLLIQLPDIAQGLLTGQRPMQVFLQQGGQMAQIAMMAEGGIAGLGKQLFGLAAGAAPVLLVAGAVAVAGAAWLSYSNEVAKATALSQGAGRVIGVNADDFDRAANAAAGLVTISVGGARDIVTSYVQLGGIGKDVLGGLTALTVDFASATGKDTKDAVEELGRAFQDPVKGAEELTDRYGVLTGAQIEHIKELVHQNDLYGAQAELLKDLEPAFDGAAEHANGLAKAWRAITTAAADGWAMMGKAIDRAMGGGTAIEQVAALQKKKAQGPTLWQQMTMGTDAFNADIDKQIAAISAKFAADEKAAGVAFARSQGAKGMGVVDSILNDNQIGDLRTRLNMVKGLLSDGGKAAGLNADQVARAREAYDMLSHAVSTYIPEGQKAVELAKIDAKLAEAKKKGNTALAASLTSQRTQIENSGKLVTSENAQAIALANANRARIEAQKSGDKHAATLAREAAAVEAQIANLYSVADAYKKSGGEALIAEARTKAESQAIKDRGNVEAAVDRQVRLAIATRVADSAKSAAALLGQASAQDRANKLVEDGILPSSRAAEYVKNQIADLPLLAAVQAAQQRGLTAEATRATKALDDQRQARLKLLQAEEQARFDADKTSSGNQIAVLEAQLQLVGATDAVRVHTLAVIRATAEAEAKYTEPGKRAAYIADQVRIADLGQQLVDQAAAYNDQLSFAADKWDLIAQNMQEASAGLADAFGPAGQALGDLTTRYAQYNAARERLDLAHNEALKKAGKDQAAIDRANTKYALQAGAAQIDMYGDMIGAAKGFFDEKSKIYKALQTAEQVYRAVQIAMSIASMFQDSAETVSHVANAGARATANAAEGVAAQAKLPFPANIAAMAATAAAVVAFGIALLGGRGGGGHVVAPPSSEDLQKAAGTGTVLGSPNDKSASIAHSLDIVAKNTDGVLQYNNEMLTSLKSIDASIGAMAATVAKQINVSGSLYDTTKLNLGSSGNAGFLGLFSSSTTRSLYDAGITLAATTVGDIVANGIAGQTYQIVQQVKKSSGFLGIGGGTKTTYQTTTGGLPSDIAASIQSVIGALENGIVAAAGSIGVDGAKAMLDNFTVNIGKLSFNGLDAQGIEDQLNAVFSSVGDQMVKAILPDIVKFQKVGEGLFETLERVASTVVAVDATMQKLGRTSTSLGIDVDMAIAGMFDSVSDFTDAANAYFETYYSSAEQTAAKTAQIAKVFSSLNLAMPDSLAGFRALVEAQDLTTAAGQRAYATLLQLAPAFADLQSALNGAKSAADIASEKADLQRQLLELQGNTAAIRALDLAKLDPSNRALQQQIYDLQDAQDAAKAAQDLADAWKSVGNSIMDEVKRIRGLTDTGSGGFASLLGQFNAATAAARAGDQDAAKSLPGLSQSLLTAAANVATSQQELRRIQAQTAASLEATYNAIAGMTGASTSSSAGTAPIDALLAAVTATQAATTPTAANDDLAAEISQLREEVAGMRAENNAGHAATAGNTGRVARTLDNVTQATGGDAVSTRAA